MDRVTYFELKGSLHADAAGEGEVPEIADVVEGIVRWALGTRILLNRICSTSSSQGATMMVGI